MSTKKKPTEPVKEEIFDDSWYENENMNNLALAREEFSESETAKLFDDNFDAWIDQINRQRNRLLDQSFPEAIVYFDDDSENLGKMLCAATWAEYERWEREEDGKWSRLFSSEDTQYNEKQLKLYQSVHQYLIVAIALARKYASPATDLWAEALDIISEYSYSSKKLVPRMYFTSTIVERLFDLDRNAAKRMRMDIIIHDLPKLNTLKAQSKKKR